MPPFLQEVLDLTVAQWENSGADGINDLLRRHHMTISAAYAQDLFPAGDTLDL
jgi:hypothetical protein